MLKALELVGFKSFADKTRFEFPPGITVVVGPNGSGKSNLVDAIKWVLGEQSAKSLRGKDMSDVIFKGSGQGHRKVMNAAEATIVFDNSDGRLSIDAPEVHVTRRVYRSGEGEYLINRQACRLKDVRDLFRGTGVGADAYSLIEQGKVDRLLQASPRDRRAIFEEAAGISRFKAKKIEAQRRLERVDQNLLRLSDIVEEVGNRLRSVRSQAAKAQRYREYTMRLQQLRTQVALTEWRALTARLDVAEGELQRLGDMLARATAEMTAAEARVLEFETELVSVSETMREREHRAARNHEQIIAREAVIERERQHLADVDAESVRARSQLALLSCRADDVAHRLQETRAQVAAAEAEEAAITARLAEQDAEVTQTLAQLDAARNDLEGLRATYLDHVKRASQTAGEIALHDARVMDCVTCPVEHVAGRHDGIAMPASQRGSRDADHQSDHHHGQELLGLLPGGQPTHRPDEDLLWGDPPDGAPGSSLRRVGGKGRRVHAVGHHMHLALRHARQRLRHRPGGADDGPSHPPYPLQQGPFRQPAAVVNIAHVPDEGRT